MSVPRDYIQKRKPILPTKHLFVGAALILVRALLWVGFTAAGTGLNIWSSVALLLLFAPSNIWGYFAMAFGALLAGGLGGAVTGFGQALALRRWLNIPASLGSFLGTILASSSALAAGTTGGWWLYSVFGALQGTFGGILIYGAIFGIMQRPMLEYLSRHSIIWVGANCAAAVCGAVSLLAVFDLSGGKRDMLQFRYPAVVYAVITGLALVLITRETRSAMASTPTPISSSSSNTDKDASSEQATSTWNIERDHMVRSGAALFRVRERHSYEAFPVNFPEDAVSANAPAKISARGPGGTTPLRRQAKTKGFDNVEPAETTAAEADVIDATYRVIS